MSLKKFTFLNSIELPNGIIIKAGESVIAHEHANLLPIHGTTVDIDRYIGCVSVTEPEVLSETSTATGTVTTAIISEPDKMQYYTPYTEQCLAYIKALEDTLMNAGILLPEDPRQDLNAPASTSIIEGPIVNEPIVEEPIIEGPIVEEPIIEGPIVNEPIIEGPIVNEPIVEEPIVAKPTRRK
jgi:hypothetical protein